MDGLEVFDDMIWDVFSPLFTAVFEDARMKGYYGNKWQMLEKREC